MGSSGPFAIAERYMLKNKCLKKAHDVLDTNEAVSVGKYLVKCSDKCRCLCSF